ncbi:Scr1 family TA system antitoxin-like transcriptional regulator [Lentzea sp. CC55]|uniref:Scr1 family TA system antitoxin-like transcriptional regulator n=1 Tax=Lentzea sp. CC55 TaxID=2884909 RepID=UPI001F1E2FC1|nr:Scr1 family TA system antitoxin-like transcriptional regulator [Lentzea sp. CC55]MCG8924155.1 helix-turn-helix transcriptional regulator [Lentzea sp. CC55]
MAQKLTAGKASLEVRALSRVVLGWRHLRSWSLAELGELVGYSAATLSQISRAVIRPSPSDVLRIGAACRAPDDEIELCARVAQRANDPQMWDRINGDAWARLVWTPWNVMLEATELLIVATDAVPELFRTNAYNEMLRKSGAVAGCLDLGWQQDVLARLDMDAKEAARPGSHGPLCVRLLVTEPVLTCSVGGVPAMIEQLGRLEDLTERTGFDLNIVNGDAGPYFGMQQSFTVMRFRAPRFDDVVLTRTLHGGDTWLESAADCEPYERALLALNNVVRTREESARWLSQASLAL